MNVSNATQQGHWGRGAADSVGVRLAEIKNDTVPGWILCVGRLKESLCYPSKRVACSLGF